ncbi:MAG: flagellin, partial [Nitrospinaceae bacterium]
NEIDRIANTTEFNGQKLVDGSLASGTASSSATGGNRIQIQVGIDSTASSRIDLNADVNLGSVSATSLGIDLLAVSTAAAALTALDSINSAIDVVTQGRGRIGAVQNRFVRTISNLSFAVENLQSAESQIRDADIAEEIALLTRNQILVQASIAAVGQANLIPQTVLQLLA